MNSHATRVFWIIGLILATLTVVEFIIAVNFDNNFSILAVFALGKTVAIVYFFMHAYRVWRTEEAH